jgi:DNA-binding MurR/RpiR family transcriptional regulator
MAMFEGRRLTPTQRRIAQCLVERFAEAAYLSSSELALLANVSQPSVTRFAVALGYEGYPELRRRLRTLASSSLVESRDDARRNEWQAAVSAEIANLNALCDMLADPTPIEQAARLLMLSRPLVVLGLRAAAPLATYFGYFAAKIHPDVRVIDTGGSIVGDRLEQSRSAGATALIAFVLPRYPRESLRALDVARRLGLKTVAVTDTVMSPAAQHTDLLLPAAVGSQLVFDSYAGPMVVATLLLQAMCDAGPAESQARLEAFELGVAERQPFVQ